MSSSVNDEKIKLKFRVTAKNGPNGRWSEKWGVSVFSHEEFQVTDQLLKMPFQGKSPEVICTFSVPHGKLEFKMLDEDRTASVNGARVRKSDLKLGDKISIGEQILIEVLIAPSTAISSESAKSAAEVNDGPTLSSVPHDEDFPPLDILEPNPTLTFAPQSDDSNAELERQRIEAETKHKLERERQAREVLNPVAQKISLAETPHGSFDPGFPDLAPDLVDDELEKEEPTVESSREVPAPIPAPAASASTFTKAQPQFVEEPKTSSRVIHADHLTPPNETIPTELSPGDMEATRVVHYIPKEKTKVSTPAPAVSVPEPIQLETQAAAQVLEKIKTAQPTQVSHTEKTQTKLRTESPVAQAQPKPMAQPSAQSGSHSNSKSASKPAAKPALKPWIPEFQPLSERVKKRATIFVGSALIALAIGAFVFMKWGNAPAPATSESMGSAQVPESLSVETINVAPLQPGIPLEEIEKKVQAL